MPVRVKRSFFCFGVVLASLACEQLTRCQENSGESSRILDRTVESFSVEDVTPLDAVLELGRHEQIPLGIEYIDREVVGKPVSVAVGRSTVRDILDMFVPVGRGYLYRVQNGVVVVTQKNVPAGKKNILNTILSEFAVNRTDLQQASSLLWMTLYKTLYPVPGPHGFVGTRRPGNPENIVGPFSLHNVTVREALNRLVSERKNAAWIVRVPAKYMNQLPNEGLWMIAEYETPPRRYGETLRRSLFGSKPPN